MRKGNVHTMPISLPSGYVLLAYIQSSGTQYVNTGFRPNHNTKMEIQYQTAQSTACGVAVADQAWKSNGFGIWANCAAYGTEVYQNAVLHGADPITAIFEKNKLYKDGSLFWTASVQTFQCPADMTLCALNRNGGMSEYTSMKLYYCKIWDNGTLIRDFVPCISDSGAVGLYDLIGKKFYGNAGTGVFTGSEVP